MKNILGLVILSVLVGSFSQAHAGLFDSEEKEVPPYKVGDVIEINHGIKLFEALRWNIPDKDFKKHRIGSHIPIELKAVNNLGGSLYGKSKSMVKLMRDVKEIQMQIEWNKVISKMSEDDLPPWHELKKTVFGYKAKIVKLAGKKCVDWNLKEKRCSSISYLREELEFVSWLPETKKYIEALVSKGKMIKSKSKKQRKLAKALAAKANLYTKSAQSSSDSACIAQSKYQNAVSWLKEMKKTGVKTYKMVQVTNQIPSFKTRLSSFKAEYQKRSGKNWNRKCPKNYVDIVEDVKTKYGIFLM